MGGEATSPMPNGLPTITALSRADASMSGSSARTLNVKLVLDRAARLGRRKDQVARLRSERRKRSGTCSCLPPLQARRGSIECGGDGGDHRVIGRRAGERGGDRLQEMIALSDRQRRSTLPKCEELALSIFCPLSPRYSPSKRTFENGRFVPRAVIRSPRRRAREASTATSRPRS
jgi:hypothetical protein